jgi:anti-sigma regulatory factor (Ser/Thr protein kinase)
MQESSQSPVLPSQVVSERTHLVVPGLPHWIEPTVEYLRQRAVLCGACHETRAGKLMVALLEAMSNAVIHGNLELGSELKERGDDSFAQALAQRASDARFAERMVDIQVDYDGETCHWVVTDEGRGFDVARVLERCLSDDPEVLLASGRGILMMTSFLDGIEYDFGGRRLIMTLKRGSGEEKRREPRVPLNLPFRVAPLKADGSPDWAAANDAVSRDFSQGGVALIQERLAQGERIVIGISVGGKMVPVPAVVRHCRSIAAGCVELGCEFQVNAGEGPAAPVASAEQTQEVHQAILDVLAQHQGPRLPDHDRREHTRVVFNKAVTVDVAGQAEPVTGYTRDLSKGGMSLIARVPLPLAVTLVRLPREGAPTLHIRSRVVRCNRIEEGFYDIGVKFLRLDAHAP